MILSYDAVRERLAASRFRSRFRLTDTERAYIATRGWDILALQSRKIVRERLADAEPQNDGSQTPMRGHAVFKAQHATATCCRGCLCKWYGIPKGRALTDAEIEAVVQLLLGWLKAQAGDLSVFPVTPDLF